MGDIPVPEILATFHLGPEGELVRTSTGNTISGSVEKSRGYSKVHIKYDEAGRSIRMYYHRLVFAMSNGYLPAYVDHKDRNKRNSDPSNLRATGWGGNVRNAGTRKRCHALPKGVHRNKKRFSASYWDPQLGRSVNLGTYDTPLEASVAFRKAFSRRFGE